MSESKKRTITLSDRPPVTIGEESWPLIASASYHDYDGQYDFQSFRHWRGFIGVRQHKDGRTIVYGTTSAAGCGSCTVAHEYALKGGELFQAGDDLVAAIHRVHDGLSREYSHDSWANLADECIADLPAEELA